MVAHSPDVREVPGVRHVPLGTGLPHLSVAVRVEAGPSRELQRTRMASALSLSRSLVLCSVLGLWSVPGKAQLWRRLAYEALAGCPRLSRPTTGLSDTVSSPDDFTFLSYSESEHSFS